MFLNISYAFFVFIDLISRTFDSFERVTQRVVIIVRTTPTNNTNHNCFKINKHNKRTRPCV